MFRATMRHPRTAVPGRRHGDVPRQGEGRNRYRFFEPEMTVAARARMALELSLRPALARGEFELHYQPRIDLRSMAIVGMEALIRWNHPQRAWSRREQFIGIAEETGLIVPIGRWVLREACHADAPPDRRIRPADPGVGERVGAPAGHATVSWPRCAPSWPAAGLAPHCLELELTESALIDDIERTAAMLANCRRWA
jgi:EAL domain-containing protein (putative c-di-GMP-specific phosphodiesterase class I)